MVHKTWRPLQALRVPRYQDRIGAPGQALLNCYSRQGIDGHAYATISIGSLSNSECERELFKNNNIERISMMPKLVVVTREGTKRTIEGGAGLSVMETIRNGGIDELLALCGGACSCATCHVYIDESWHSKVGPITDNERDLLDFSDHRNERSRLSCQIPFTEELDGLEVTVAPED